MTHRFGTHALTCIVVVSEDDRRLVNKVCEIKYRLRIESSEMRHIIIYRHHIVL